MAEFEKLKRKFDDIFEEMAKVIVGQRDVIEQVLKVQGKWMNNDAYHW